MVILTGFLCICGYVDKFVEKIKNIKLHIYKLKILKYNNK